MTHKTHKTIYVCAWSLGLLFATMPTLFDGTLFPLKHGDNVYQTYSYPIAFVMALFLIDIVYAFYQEEVKDKLQNVGPVLKCLIVFVVCFVLSHNPRICGWQQGILFAILWLALTYAKFVKTEVAVAKNIKKVKHKISDK